MYEARTQTTPLPKDVFIPPIEDDTEEAPWTVMGDAQFWTATGFASTLHIYAQARHLPWYVAGMLPILYRRPGEAKTRQVAPDVFVAFVPRRVRESYDLAEERIFPAFVLEVLSSSSATRDMVKKRGLYEALGAREYVLFAPEPGLLSPPLQGYRRNVAGRFERWPPDTDGSLLSEVLGLRLLVEGERLRALDEDGRPLLTHAESEAARVSVEAELARLRAMLENTRDED